MRCVGVDIRQHDNHVTRAQVRVGTEAGEQLVVKNLHFTLGAVSDMEAYRAILGRIDFRP
ncbi:hypothetical protein D3C76_1734160 [compost metagenome]